MKIHRTAEEMVDAGDSRAYLASSRGFLKGVKVGAPDKPIHGYFIGDVVKCPSDLEAIDPQIILFNFVPVPALIVAEATAVFRHVYHNYEGAEMIVLLRWKEIDLGEGRKIGQYYLDRADRVEVAAAGLDYTQNVPIVGSLHSHGNFGAGFSSTDDRWERDDTPGIYITVGNVNTDTPSIETSIGGLGVRKIVESPSISPEVMNSVVLSKERLDWWTKTLVVKRCSRSTGFYICCGSTVTGWSPDESWTTLKTGERFIGVHEFNQQRKTSTSLTKIKKFTPKTKTILAADTDSIPLSLNDYKKMEKFIKFLRKKAAFGEFIFQLMSDATEEENEEIANMLLLCEEEEERKNSLWPEYQESNGRSSCWDAEESDTMWAKQWLE